MGRCYAIFKTFDAGNAAFVGLRSTRYPEKVILEQPRNLMIDAIAEIFAIAAPAKLQIATKTTMPPSALEQAGRRQGIRAVWSPYRELPSVAARTAMFGTYHLTSTGRGKITCKWGPASFASGEMRPVV
jgi:hypothetical protein